MNRPPLALAAAAALAALAAGPAADRPPSARGAGPTDPAPALLTWSQQIEVRDRWVARRHEMLPGMMRRHGFDWWIVVRRPTGRAVVISSRRPPKRCGGFWLTRLVAKHGPSMVGTDNGEL